MPDLICLGDLLIDFCSTAVDVSVADAPAFTKAPGGAPANVAVAAVRQDVSVGFVGAVGRDPFGEFLAGVLDAEGVDTSRLARRADVKTPLASVAVRSDGAGDFFFHHDAGLAPLTEDDIDASAIASARALHFGSISRIEPDARAATDEARRLAAEAGVIVSYDPNYRPRLWDSADEARRRIFEGFEGVTVAKVSDKEWGFIFDTGDFSAGCRRLLDCGVELVIRSEGGDGASFASLAAAGHVDGFTVTPVEFTGAGDAFVGSVLADLLAEDARPGELDEKDLRQIVVRANAAGAITTTGTGAIPSLPTRSQVEAFLADRRDGG